MVRSLGFGSIIYDITQRLFRLVFTLATENFFNHAKNYKSPAHSSTGMRSIFLPQIDCSRFHILFHSPIGVLFHLSLTVLFAISDSRVFSLTRWSSLIHKGFHVSQATRDIVLEDRKLDFHHLWYRFQLFKLSFLFELPTTLN